VAISVAVRGEKGKRSGGWEEADESLADWKIAGCLNRWELWKPEGWVVLIGLIVLVVLVVTDGQVSVSVQTLWTEDQCYRQWPAGYFVEAS